MKILGIVLIVIGVLGDILALYLGIAFWKITAPFPIMMIFFSSVFIGIGIGIIGTENEKSNNIKK